MNVREQIKQTVMHLAYKVEKALHRYRTQSEQEEKTEKSSKESPGQVRTYYNNSKEERKLH